MLEGLTERWCKRREQSDHGYQLDGSPQCLNCHIGVPHGWVRPRLLVNSDIDKAPYLSPYALGTTSKGKVGSTVAGITRKTYTIKTDAGWGQGFNGETMEFLAATDSHLLDSYGMTVWNVETCDACGQLGHAHPGAMFDDSTKSKIIPFVVLDKQ